MALCDDIENSVHRKDKDLVFWGDFQALVFPAGIVVQLFAGNAAQQSFLFVVNGLILHFGNIVSLKNLLTMLGMCFYGTKNDCN